MAGRAIIVGAGIGGLTAARALRREGFEVTVLERSSTLEPLGAGISLWPNATRILPRLGIRDLPASPSVVIGGIRRKDGRMMASTDLRAIEARFGAPMVLLHRATLQHALLADGIEDVVQRDADVVRIDEEGDKIVAVTANGKAIGGDLLIGADGINSTLRSLLLDDGRPRHSGLLAYRATVQWDGEAEFGEFWGDGITVGIVPIDGGRIYWFATRRTQGDEPPEENPIPALLERLEGWTPQLSAIVAATPPEAVLRHDLCDRSPTRQLVDGRVALLGDAAHPMLPFLGQGACQAIEDAEEIAQALGEETDVRDALRAYEKRRRRRVAAIVKASHRMGRLIHLRPAPLRALRDRALSMTPEGVRMRQLDSVIGTASN